MMYKVLPGFISLILTQLCINSVLATESPDFIIMPDKFQTIIDSELDPKFSKSMTYLFPLASAFKLDIPQDLEHIRKKEQSKITIDRRGAFRKVFSGNPKKKIREIILARYQFFEKNVYLYGRFSSENLEIILNYLITAEIFNPKKHKSKNIIYYEVLFTCLSAMINNYPYRKNKNKSYSPSIKPFKFAFNLFRDEQLEQSWPIKHRESYKKYLSKSFELLLAFHFLKGEYGFLLRHTQNIYMSAVQERLWFLNKSISLESSTFDFMRKTHPIEMKKIQNLDIRNIHKIDYMVKMYAGKLMESNDLDSFDETFCKIVYHSISGGARLPTLDLSERASAMEELYKKIENNYHLGTRGSKLFLRNYLFQMLALEPSKDLVSKIKTLLDKN